MCFYGYFVVIKPVAWLFPKAAILKLHLLMMISNHTVLVKGLQGEKIYDRPAASISRA